MLPFLIVGGVVLGVFALKKAMGEPIGQPAPSPAGQDIVEWLKQYWYIPVSIIALLIILGVGGTRRWR